jgi:hypothetical protein
MNNTTYARRPTQRRTYHTPTQAQHPAQEAVESVIRQYEGEFQLRAQFIKDDASMTVFRRPNSVVVGYICRLFDSENRCLSEGRGVSIISFQTGRYINKAILYARNASLIDCVSRASKLSTVFASDEEDGSEISQNSYASNPPEQQPSEKQVKYLTSLIETLPSDEQTDLLTRLPQMSRYDVSQLINTLKEI